MGTASEIIGRMFQDQLKVVGYIIQDDYFGGVEFSVARPGETLEVGVLIDNNEIDLLHEGDPVLILLADPDAISKAVQVVKEILPLQ
jgi:hypothetical protein